MIKNDFIQKRTFRIDTVTFMRVLCLLKKKNMRRRSIIIVLCQTLIISQTAFAQVKQKIYSIPGDSIRTWLKIYHVPAVGIGIIENGKVKSVQVYGELSPGVPAPADAIWNVASLTKPVTAVVTLAMVDKGLLTLDEPLSGYYIDQDIKGNPWTAELTPRIMLSHQSGFKNWPYLEPDKKLAFHFEPGHGYHYSGAGYEYLRKALENKFKQTLPQLAAKYLFNRAEMKDTWYGWSAKVDSARFAEPQNDKGEIYKARLRTANAADWLLTTVSDYSKFGAYVINGCGLSADLFHKMTSTQVNMDTIARHKADGMGLGWEVIRSLPHGEYVLTHDGSDQGVHTLVLLLPVSKRGIVIFTNGDEGEKIIAAILKASKIDLAPELSEYMDEFK